MSLIFLSSHIGSDVIEKMVLIIYVLEIGKEKLDSVLFVLFIFFKSLLKKFFCVCKSKTNTRSRNVLKAFSIDAVVALIPEVDLTFILMSFCFLLKQFSR